MKENESNSIVHSTLRPSFKRLPTGIYCATVLLYCHVIAVCSAIPVYRDVDVHNIDTKQRDDLGQLHPGMLLDDLILTASDVIMLSEAYHQHLQQHRRRTERKIINFDIYSDRKWTFPIKYAMDRETFQNETYLEVIRRAIKEWEKVTCVRFEELENTTGITERHLLFMNITAYGCSSYLGKVPLNATKPQNLENEYSQPVYLADYCFQYLGTVMHELGHALGLLHEIQRPDRDEHLLVLYDNIKNGTLMNFLAFDEAHVQLDDIPYDLGSLMHYPPLVYSVDVYNLEFTSLPLEGEKLFVMGQYVEIAFYDAKVINNQYCNTAATVKLECKNSGYPHPTDGENCICPAEWTGVLCDQIHTGSDGCSPRSGRQEHFLPSSEEFSLLSPNYFNAENPMYTEGDSCYWLITTLSTHHIGWWLGGNNDTMSDIVLGLPMSGHAGCQAWIEVRKPDDIRGIRICGQFNSTELGIWGAITWSYSSQLHISFRSFDTALQFLPSLDKRGFRFMYRMGEKPSTIKPRKQEETLLAYMKLLEIQLNSSTNTKPSWIQTYQDALQPVVAITTAKSKTVIDQHNWVGLVVAFCACLGCGVLLFLIGLFYCAKDRHKNMQGVKTPSTKRDVNEKVEETYPETHELMLGEDKHHRR